MLLNLYIGFEWENQFSTTREESRLLNGDAIGADRRASWPYYRVDRSHTATCPLPQYKCLSHKHGLRGYSQPSPDTVQENAVFTILTNMYIENRQRLQSEHLFSSGDNELKAGIIFSIPQNCGSYYQTSLAGTSLSYERLFHYLETIKHKSPEHFSPVW
jgi:hypothetical protein